ncbi:MAG: outer membrane lipoprotein carrier protein LolA [Bacteroidetes bacterium]|nr:outer membrane lipoprotein carrier protein LolA [Fibrella sp.]
MKKIAILLSLVAGLLSPVLAQKDTRAGTVLDAMSAKYKALGSYQTAFTYTSGKESYKGDVTVKATKFRLKLAGQEVFNDGQTLSTYVKESNEVNVQDYEEGTSGEFNPTTIYSIYKKGFSYKFLKEIKQGGRTLEVVELVPEKKKSQIAKLQISVDKADKSVRSWTITNKDGQVTTYVINKFTPNIAVADSYFAFDKSKYPGVEVVDLR